MEIHINWPLTYFVQHIKQFGRAYTTIRHSVKLFPNELSREYTHMLDPLLIFNISNYNHLNTFTTDSVII